ncbi:hypothetical protein DIS24_g778 [Lasiodiplodia hormozganensis]|uniref:Uncharacterized protein n=1 Tax=Lasiodiplodia hormozganensis TaxID=869390 RepID=A0AA40D5T7_9PEZI|nr:hypothetical protein DIS24_g778 [Lasiodiplodia hormozganensis]
MSHDAIGIESLGWPSIRAFFLGFMVEVGLECAVDDLSLGVEWDYLGEMEQEHSLREHRLRRPDHQVQNLPENQERNLPEQSLHLERPPAQRREHLLVHRLEHLPAHHLEHLLVHRWGQSGRVEV